ncbi:hypothetical protein HanRHA438_Chr07g0299241 [Helianthus annuus]|nr:hypothetical protein HanHA300_Chr07g0237301 [Helianthus annuus]KAJ0556238.1 hypothetical protein HanIR_Chr07g0311481 [Helianthus annuus]KAJ0562687.1 hypothetical protein HanHA89_Chr07g0254471 [Helianthus annuus]KAJ0728064.1 hypothetical protein HanLR1_Chr07g0237251 [Helianthus annuus]KAJ0730840.1 hypothetical protein HanOQP8_Chr07g0244981 [Helianthus annuus]
MFGIEKDIKVTCLESRGRCNESCAKPRTSAPKRTTCGDQSQIVSFALFMEF